MKNRNPEATAQVLHDGEKSVNVVTKPVFYAILAAALYALNSPLSKLLLRDVPPTMMAGFLYLGAGLGMTVMGMVRKRTGHGGREVRLTRKDLPYTLGMIVLDIAAPIFLMIGLSRTTAANASLLNNFEIVATSLIAMLLFREQISRQLWAAIGLITLSSILLSVEDAGCFRFSVGSLFVLLACTCWGLENNCTRCLSRCDPLEIGSLEGLLLRDRVRADRLCGGGKPAGIRGYSQNSAPWLCRLRAEHLYLDVHAQRHLGAAV